MLLLRKECQPILDAAGLGNLHIEVQDKCLVLVGECGKPLINVRGITFSKPAINNSERIYAVELFTQFLSKYVTDIITYIAAKKAYALTPQPVPEEGFVANQNTTGYGDTLQTFHIVSFKLTLADNIINVTVGNSGITFNNAIPVTEIETLADTLRDSVSTAKEFIADIIIYTEEGKRINNLRAKLAACDI
jgi:hypothetical protein